MTIAIMQPTYLPWAGYFNLIARSKAFIFLDDVQLSHQSWQQRNRIVVNGQPCFLTVPVRTTDRGPQLIRDVQVDESKNWRRKHVRTVQQAYARHPYGHEVTALVEELLTSEQPLLAEINMGLIRAFCRAMGLMPAFYRSSELQIEGARSDRLLKMCRRFGTNTYLSPPGSKDYLEADGVFATSNVQVIYQDFIAAPYPQRGVKDFISHMSIVDLLANVGYQEGRKYVEQSTACANTI
jgi:WbqC-like protein family